MPFKPCHPKQQPQSIDQDISVQLEPRQAYRNGHIRDLRIRILVEAIALGQDGVLVLHQMEGLERAVGSDELPDLPLRQIIR